MREIGQAVAQEGLHSQVTALKKELKILATECSKAFAAVEMDQSQHPQVKKALELCSSYVCPTHKSVQPITASTAIGELWKKEGNMADVALPEDKTALATAVLGTSLVNTLVEKDHQPPDVSHANVKYYRNLLVTYV